MSIEAAPYPVEKVNPRQPINQGNMDERQFMNQGNVNVGGTYKDEKILTKKNL